MKRLVLAAVFVAVLGCGYYYRDFFLGLVGDATETRSARPPAPAQLVVAGAASESPTPIEVSAIGTVQPIATIQIKSRMDGEIARVNFEEGQEVKEGDILFTLDDRAVKALVDQSAANLERDRSQLDRARLEYKRQSDLATRGAATAQKLEDAKTAMDVGEAATRASGATLESAKVSLNYTIIRSPLTGRTGAVGFKKGSIVKAVDTSPTVPPLVTITQMKPIYVLFTVPERHLGDVRAAMASGPLPVTVTVPSEPKAPITGTLTFIDNQVDAATGTISLKAKFPNDDERLWPGQFVNVTVTLGVQAKAVVVPSVAIQVGPNGPYAFVIKQDSTVELRLIRPDRTVGDKTVVAEGLAAGERVVVDGQLRLGNGSRVNAQEPKGAAPKQEPKGSAPKAQSSPEGASPKAQSTPVAERTP
jgi:multidrug efflux system membrane fusion protein